MTTFRPTRTNLGLLPRVEDSWTFLYVERRRIHQAAFSIRLLSEKGVVEVPISQFNVLLLGPGVSITSAAVKALADHGCTIVWTGENGVRFYASGCPDTNKASNLHAQARLWADPVENLKVVRRLYVLRYGETFPESSNRDVLRGYEGAKVRQAYIDQAVKHGLAWKGRKWTKGQWDITDKMNRAVSVSSSCLYGLCHAVLVAVGFSPALGFIHSGDMRSFVLDVADIYRERITIPLAFQAAATCATASVDSVVRKACREAFQDQKLISRIVPDVYEVLGKARVGAKFLDISAWEALRPKS